MSKLYFFIRATNPQRPPDYQLESVRPKRKGFECVPPKRTEVYPFYFVDLKISEGMKANKISKYSLKCSVFNTYKTQQNLKPIFKTLKKVPMQNLLGIEFL